MRFCTAIFGILATVVAFPAAEPPKTGSPATAITWNKTNSVVGEVADSLTKQSGIPIAVPPALLKTKCDLRFDKTPFWEALDALADKTQTRIALTDGGRKVELIARGNSLEVATANGAFRVAAQQVVGRALLDSGVVTHEATLLVHWEPRLRVYRIDTAPRLTKATDATGTAFTADAGGGQVLPTNATSELRVRLAGITRKTDRIAKLSGEFHAVVADKLLAFAFDAPGGKLPEPQKQDNVTAKLKRLQKKGKDWEVVIEVTYPPGQPVFESFQGEWWLRDNRLLLRSPDGKVTAIDDYEIPTPGQTAPLVVIHRYTEDATKGLGDPTAKGWSLVYETPSPLAEVRVPFELKNIPLP